MHAGSGLSRNKIISTAGLRSHSIMPVPFSGCMQILSSWNRRLSILHNFPYYTTFSSPLYFLAQSFGLDKCLSFDVAGAGRTFLRALSISVTLIALRTTCQIGSMFTHQWIGYTRVYLFNLFNRNTARALPPRLRIEPSAVEGRCEKTLANTSFVRECAQKGLFVKMRAHITCNS
ncbi:unnamed protein product [Ixodes pacificus]